MNYWWVFEWFIPHHAWSTKLIINKGCIQLGNLDLGFKIQILDLQLNAKSENGFQHWDHAEISVLDFLFTVWLGNPKKDHAHA